MGKMGKNYQMMLVRCVAFPTLSEVPPVAVPLPMLDLEPSVVPGVGAS